MRAKLVIVVLVVALAAAALIGGIVAVAGADQTNPLPPVSAQDLLAKMAQQGDQTKNLSGEVAWQNNLLGDLSGLMGSAGMGDQGAKLPLAGNGSGRVWLSQTGARVESQGSSGDQVVVANKQAHDIWMYDSGANTAKHVVMVGTPPAGATPQPEPAMVTPDAISTFLQRLAPLATVDVGSQGNVAGRDVYYLTLTPTAPDTALGSGQAAIDGQTFTPLQLQVFAKGDPTPVLEFGFTSVSYDPIAADLFAFTPPAGTDVTTKTVDLNKAMQGHKGMMKGPGKGEPSKMQQKMMKQLMQRALLSAPEAQKLVHFKLYTADQTARPYQWAAVVGKGGPMTAVGKPLMALMQASGMKGMMGAPGTKAGPGMMDAPGMMGAPAGAPAGTSAKQAHMGPAAVLLYGKSLGTIVLAETKTTPQIAKELTKLPKLVDSTTLNGATVRSFTTELGGVYVWQKGDTTLMAAGIVPKADLAAFVASVQ